jgi:hypothetical protein
MKIVKRKEFLALPRGTVFMSYRPCVFGDLAVKGDTWGNDFLVDDLTGAVSSESSEDLLAKCDAMEAGASVAVDFEYTGRDGCFGDDEGMFAVYEPADVDLLIARLQQANKDARG